MYKLYKIANRVNENLYLGITKLGLDQEWAEHLKDPRPPKYLLRFAIKKHGKEFFSIKTRHQMSEHAIINQNDKNSAAERRIACAVLKNRISAITLNI